MIPAYTESDLYYFDEEAANRPIEKIELYCRHFQGRHAGKKFTLLEWQKQLIRTLFGWKRRADGLRRFQELLLLTAKGTGKTPLLAAIGLYMLLMDGEASPIVISMASTSEQARYTFDAAKAYINQDEKLQRFASCKQHEIRGIKNNGKWTTISGSPNGRSGGQPSCIIGDEVMEWKEATAKAFELLKANAFKRSQPLVLLATNAGEDEHSYAHQQYERALAIRDGKIQDDTVLPVIFETPEDLPWDSEEAAKASNPSMGQIIEFQVSGPSPSQSERVSREGIRI